MSIGVRFGAEELTILQAGKKLAEILYALIELDEIFSIPVLITGQKSDLQIELRKESLESQIRRISAGILKREWNEITQFEGK